MIARTLAAVLAALALCSPARAQDREDAPERPASDPVAQRLKKIAELGPGVHAVQLDKKGRIQSCLVVGESRISTALGKSKGMETARKRAAISAQAEFVKWIKNKVDVHEGTRDETTFFLEGNEGNDEDAVRESGKSIEKTETRVTTMAQGMARGFEVLHQEVKGEDKNLTLVYGWKAATARATRGIEKDEADGATGAGKAARGSKGEGSNGEGKSKDGGAQDKTIKDRSTTSDSAGDYLPK